MSTCCAGTLCVCLWGVLSESAIHHGVDITGMMIKKKKDFLLPNLVKATGVETLLRFPSSARFDEFPVQGKSFPLRNTINCSLQVELSTDCSAEEETGEAASGTWIEATATEFCGWNTKKREKKGKYKLNNVPEMRRGGETNSYRVMRPVNCFPLPDWRRPQTASDQGSEKHV